MRIKLSPDGNLPAQLALTKSGDVLSVNGEDFDFSRMGNGDTLPVSAIAGIWFRADVQRQDDGELVVTVALPNGPDASPEQRFPVDLINVPDGPVALPQPLPPIDPPAEDAA